MELKIKTKMLVWNRGRDGRCDRPKLPSWLFWNVGNLADSAKHVSCVTCRVANPDPWRWLHIAAFGSWVAHFIAHWELG